MDIKITSSLCSLSPYEFLDLIQKLKSNVDVFLCIFNKLSDINQISIPDQTVVAFSTVLIIVSHTKTVLEELLSSHFSKLILFFTSKI